MSTELKLTQQQAEAIGQFQKLKVGALFMRVRENPHRR